LRDSRSPDELDEDDELELDDDELELLELLVLIELDEVLWLLVDCELLTELLDTLLVEELDELDELELEVELADETLEALLVEELDELDEEDSSSSCRAKTQRLYDCVSVTAVILIVCEEESVTANPSSAGCIFINTPWPRRAPPVAAVCVPIGVQPFAAPGSTSSEPAVPIAVSFLTITQTISSTGSIS
jgi:hypothetical protein